jgi:hypothetical protein
MYVCVDVERERVDKQLDYMIMEAEKSQNLQSAAWTPRKNSDIVLF